MRGRLAVLVVGLALLAVPGSQAATADTASAVASPGPYRVGEPITFTSTTPCTVSCRLLWKWLNGTRLGQQIGDGDNTQPSTPPFTFPPDRTGWQTVQLDLSEFCVGTTRVTCDSYATVSVFIQDAVTPPPADTTAPTITVSAASAVEATGPSTPLPYAVAATDPDDSASTPSCSPVSGAGLPVGTTTVDCSATDSHGNIGRASFDVAVKDTTAPVVSVPGPMMVAATSSAGATVTYAASATDAVDGVIAPVCSTASGATFPIGATTVTCAATDTHQNTSSASFLVDVTPFADPAPATPPAVPPAAPPAAPLVPPTVVDATPPTMVLPATIVVSATSPAGAVVRYSVAATDSAGVPVAATCSRATAAIFPIGTTTVSCTATDSRGNVAPSRAFTVHVKGAAEQLADAVRQAVAWQARSPALPDRLRAVAHVLAVKRAQGCRLLAAVAHDLRGPLGKPYTTAQRATLRSELARIAAVAGCGR